MRRKGQEAQSEKQNSQNKSKEQGNLDRKKIRALDEAFNVSEKKPQGMIGVEIKTAMEALEVRNAGVVSHATMMSTGPCGSPKGWRLSVQAANESRMASLESGIVATQKPPPNACLHELSQNRTVDEARI